MFQSTFAHTQRVIIPAERAGAENVQGVITDIQTFVGREPQVGLQWLNSGTVDSNLELLIVRADCSESELLQAQPPKTVTVDAAQKLIAQSYLDGAQAQREQLAREAKREARRAAARKRKR